MDVKKWIFWNPQLLGEGHSQYSRFLREAMLLYTQYNKKDGIHVLILHVSIQALPAMLPLLDIMSHS